MSFRFVSVLLLFARHSEESQEKLRNNFTLVDQSSTIVAQFLFNSSPLILFIFFYFSPNFCNHFSSVIDLDSSRAGVQVSIISMAK